MSVPILAIGAASPAAQTIGLDGLLAGAADFIPKPFGCDELLARLQTLFAMSHGASGTGETAACVVDVDSRGYVLTASRAAISALVLPVACRGVHLATHLSQGFDLVPSSSWRDLVELGAEGFMRTLFPNAPGSDVVLEVFPEVQTTGHRLSITPVVVPSWRSHRARVFYRSASSPAAC
jgi:hypothetical protein